MYQLKQQTRTTTLKMKMKSVQLSNLIQMLMSNLVFLAIWCNQVGLIIVFIACIVIYSFKHFIAYFYNFRFKLWTRHKDFFLHKR